VVAFDPRNLAVREKRADGKRGPGPPLALRAIADTDPARFTDDIDPQLSASA
jgi:hypothetical protein